MTFHSIWTFQNFIICLDIVKLLFLARYGDHLEMRFILITRVNSRISPVGQFKPPFRFLKRAFGNTPGHAMCATWPINDKWSKEGLLCTPLYLLPFFPLALLSSSMGRKRKQVAHHPRASRPPRTKMAARQEPFETREEERKLACSLQPCLEAGKQFLHSGALCVAAVWTCGNLSH